MGATQHVVLGVYWYQTDGTYISTGVAKNSEVAAIDTWEQYSAVLTAPSNAAWAVVVIGKDCAGAGDEFLAYWANVDFDRFPFAFHGKSGADSLTTGSTCQVDLEAYDYGDVFDTVTYTFTAPVDDVYAFTVAGIVNDLDDGEFFSLKLMIGGTAYAQSVVGSAANQDLTMSIAAEVLMAAGDTATLEVEHDHGSGLVVQIRAFTAIQRLR
jgi:hypothetical protein